LLNKAGAKRSSDKAKQQVLYLIEERAEQISKKAVTFSKHAKRKTIKKTDVFLASKN